MMCLWSTVTNSIKRKTFLGLILNSNFTKQTKTIDLSCDQEEQKQLDSFLPLILPCPFNSNTINGIVRGYPRVTNRVHYIIHPALSSVLNDSGIRHIMRITVIRIWCLGSILPDRVLSSVITENAGWFILWAHQNGCSSLHFGPNGSWQGLRKPTNRNQLIPPWQVICHDSWR